MKKVIDGLLKVFFILALMLVVFGAPVMAENFEDQNLKVTTKLPPQWLGWVIETSSANPQNQTVPVYYKITAVVPGIGETVASAVTTGYSATGPLVSTNSLRIMWAPVNGATSYKLYKSVDNSSFYLHYSGALLTFVDEGASNGAAFSAATPRGGNLTVENDASVGDDLTVTGSLVMSSTFSGPARLESKTIAALKLITPTAIGELYVCSDCSPVEVAMSTGAVLGGFGNTSGAQLN